MFFFIGILSSLGFGPIFFFPGTILGFYLFMQRMYHKIDIKDAFFFGYGHFLISSYWIGYGPKVFDSSLWWMVPLGVIIFPSILAITFVLQAYLMRCFVPSSKFFFFVNFSLLWIFFELLRTFLGFPWNLLGYVLNFNDSLMQTADILGVYGLSFIVLNFVNIFFNKSFFSIFLVLISYIYGLKKLGEYHPKCQKINARIVQAAIDQKSKMNVDDFKKNLDIHISMSEFSSPTDFIFWSEDAVIMPINFPGLENYITNYIPNNTFLITGSLVKEDGKSYSANVALGSDGIKFKYYKAHLVPFGEYMPNFLPFYKITAGFENYAHGDFKVINELKHKGENIKIKNMICFEAIFPEEIKMKESVNFILNTTNDAWYADTLQPWQHLEISRLRAIENGTPIIRVANTGISGIIDPVGRVIQSTNHQEKVKLDSCIPESIKNRRIYSYFSDYLLLFLITCYLLIIKITRKGINDSIVS